MKIKYLRIQTANFEQQLAFYSETLGLPILGQNESSFRVKIGYSELEFSRNKKSVPGHIAFHIGANQENEALQWIQEKVRILEDESQKIIDFPAWNAKSIYFYDADQNILEFISRAHLHPQKEAFSEKSLVGIAEVGLATKDVGENFKFLEQSLKLEIYFGSPDVFCAIGDEHGLLIAVDQDRKTWFPTKDPALPATFDLKFERQGKTLELSYDQGKLGVM